MSSASENSVRDVLAMDFGGSVRSKDDNGFLHVSVSNLTKETVNPYRGREIPGWQERGLAPDRVYYGYRAGSELEKGAHTFSGLPLLLDHHLEDAESPQKHCRVGTVGTDARWEAPYVKAALVVTDADAIRAIEDGSMRELSCAYRYDPLWKAGTFGGEDYDFVMTNIRGNHVALVAEGRAGADVVVADAKPRMPEKQSVEDNMMKLFDKRFNGACDAFPDTEPQEEGVPGQGIDPEVGDSADAPEGEASSVKSTIMAIIDKLGPDELNALADALTSVAGGGADSEMEDEEPAPAVGEEPVEDAEMEDAPAEEEEDKEEEEEAPAEDSCGASDAAFDAAIQQVFAHAVKAAEERTVKRFRALSEAAEAVRPVLGAVDPLAFDSASGIYGAALRKLGVDVRKHPRSAWKSMYAAVRRSAQMAQDAAYKAPLPKGFEGHFEGLNRIKRG